MRAILFLVFIVAQSSSAIECLRAGHPYELVVLEGTVEYHTDPGPPRPFPVILKLTAPICVEGTKIDGTRFRKHLASLKIENFMDLKEGLPTNKRVTLRGQLWRDMFDDDEPVTFGVQDVL